MALEKSELYSFLWQSCDELRGCLDASQYKDYVLVLLFVKYVSDRFAGQRYGHPAGQCLADRSRLEGSSHRTGSGMTISMPRNVARASNAETAP